MGYPRFIRRDTPCKPLLLESGERFRPLLPWGIWEVLRPRFARGRFPPSLMGQWRARHGSPPVIDVVGLPCRAPPSLVGGDLVPPLPTAVEAIGGALTCVSPLLPLAAEDVGEIASFDSSPLSSSLEEEESYSWDEFDEVVEACPLDCRVFLVVTWDLGPIVPP